MIEKGKITFKTRERGGIGKSFVDMKGNGKRPFTFIRGKEGKVSILYNVLDVNR